MKSCITCLKELPEDNFYRTKRGPLESYCRGCKNIRSKRYYKSHRKQKRVYDKKYAEKHKERIAKRRRLYALRNKYKIAEYKRQWEQKNKERIVEQRRLYRLEHRQEILVYMRKYHKLPKEAYTPNYFQPFTEPDKIYAKQLRSGEAISPTSEWRAEWTEKAIENNNRIMLKYSTSPSPESVELEHQKEIVIG